MKSHVWSHLGAGGDEGCHLLLAHLHKPHTKHFSACSLSLAGRGNGGRAYVEVLGCLYEGGRVPWGVGG